jgi:hypothetical protein
MAIARKSIGWGMPVSADPTLPNNPIAGESAISELERQADALRSRIVWVMRELDECNTALIECNAKIEQEKRLSGK